jgi:hypothetical protein
VITRKRRQVSHTELYAAEVICDRCQMPARHSQGFGVPGEGYEGILGKGLFFPPTGNLAELERFEFELCGPCCREMLAWIGPGAYVGTKGRDLVTNVPNLAA